MQNEVINSCMAYSNEHSNIGSDFGGIFSLSGGKGKNSNAILEALGVQRKRLNKLKAGKGGGVFSAILGNKEKEEKEAGG